MDQPFTDKQVADALKCLTPSMPRALLALPHAPGVWLTVSEMRHRGCTGSNVDVLHSMNLQNPLCLRRWRRWGGEPGQKRDVGYEYSITPLGVAVRNAFASPAASSPDARPVHAVEAAHEPTEQGSGDG